MALTTTAQAIDVFQARFSERELKQIADGVLTLMAFTALPDITTSSLSINNAGTGDPGLSQSTLGGGFTLSQDFPLYLEGTLGYSRFDPKFVATDGREERIIPTKWNSFAGTGGIGWDFPITQNKELKLRPILNFTLGHVATDARLAQTYINAKLDTDLAVIDGGRMNAYGLGGAIMLDYEHYRTDYEIDVEARYTKIQLRTFSGTTNGLAGESETNAASLWGRWRAPTSLTMLQRPLRYVLETSFTAYFGPQRGALGFNNLTSIGAGFELDSSAYPVFVTRTRLLGRYVFGENVSGFSVGLAMSF